MNFFLLYLFLPIARIFIFGVIFILGLSRLFYEIAVHIIYNKKID